MTVRGHRWYRFVAACPGCDAPVPFHIASWTYTVMRRLPDATPITKKRCANRGCRSWVWLTVYSFRNAA